METKTNPQTAPATIDNDTIFKLITNGDTSALSPEQKLAYYKVRCEAAGLDPRTSPFRFFKLQGREVLYATKEASDQLASNHKIHVEILSQITESGVRVVVVRATAADGRQTDEIGVVPIDGLKGDMLSNALMRAVTKAKRRAILSLCGLGTMDETELETIPDVGQIQTPEPPRVPLSTHVPASSIPQVATQPNMPITAITKFIPASVEKKSAKNGNPFFIIFDGNIKYRTFHGGLGSLAMDAFERMKEITVEYHGGKFGREIDDLRFTDPLENIQHENEIVADAAQAEAVAEETEEPIPF